MFCERLISSPMLRHSHFTELEANDEARFLQEFLVQTFGAQIIEQQPQTKLFPLEITI